ncbi:MAG: lipoyl(octanoyl) transferase LipB [Proteobacteria bacterium]|nr:lipoyl(octanoyl) transferase LipB [Pseudomonadota bacterium]
MSRQWRVKLMGQQPYEATWDAMKTFTAERTAETVDELWLLEHPPVYTLGQAGKSEHVLAAGGIPVVRTDRGGQVTYHGPGQLVAYLLLDIRRLGIGVRDLVTGIERSVIQLLAGQGIAAIARTDAPGVYVDNRKVASLGLRIRKGCSYHGLSLNVDMDLAPFVGINPCGHAGLEVTDLKTLGVSLPFSQIAEMMSGQLAIEFGYDVAPVELV